VSEHTLGFAEAYARAHEIAPDLATTARATGLTQGCVQYFFDLFYASARVVTCYSQGVNQSAQGTDKVNAIINCHLATGRIGRPGMARSRSPASPTPWAGARSAGSPISSPPTWVSRQLKSIGTAVLERAAHGRARGSQGGRNVRGDRARRDQSAVGDGHQSGGVAAARRRRARGAQAA